MGFSKKKPDSCNEVFKISSEYVKEGFKIRIFAFQSDKEKQEGLPVQKHMDRDHVTKPSAQIGFISHILLPMFKCLAKVRTKI